MILETLKKICNFSFLNIYIYLFKFYRYNYSRMGSDDQILLHNFHNHYNVMFFLVYIFSTFYKIYNSISFLKNLINAHYLLYYFLSVKFILFVFLELFLVLL